MVYIDIFLKIQDWEEGSSRIQKNMVFLLSDPNVNVAFYVNLKWYNLKIVSLDAQTLK